MTPLSTGSMIAATHDAPPPTRRRLVDGMVVLATSLLFANVPVLLSQRTAVPFLVAAAVVPGLLLVSVITNHERLALPAAPLTAMTGHLAVVVLASVMATSPDLAAREVVTFLAEGMLLYVLLLTAVRTTSTLRIALVGLAVTATLLSALSVWQVATSSFEIELQGLAQHSVDDVAELDEAGAIVRVAGPVGEKNRYAQVLLMVLPLPLLTALRGRTAGARLVAAAATVLIFGAVGLTLSRGGAVAALALGAALVAIRALRLRAFVLGLVVVVAAGLLLLPGWGDRLVDATTTLRRESPSEVDGAVQGRLASNIGAARVFAAHPVLGVGPGNYPIHHKDAVEDLGLRVVPNREPHNLYLDIAAETGILGLASFSILIATTLVRLVRVRAHLPTGSTGEVLATALLLGIIAYLAAGVFLHLSFGRYLWMLLALAACAGRFPAGRTRSALGGTGAALSTHVGGGLRS